MDPHTRHRAREKAEAIVPYIGERCDFLPSFFIFFPLFHRNIRYYAPNGNASQFSDEHQRVPEIGARGMCLPMLGETSVFDWIRGNLGNFCQQM